MSRVSPEDFRLIQAARQTAKTAFEAFLVQNQGLFDVLDLDEVNMVVDAHFDDMLAGMLGEGCSCCGGPLDASDAEDDDEPPVIPPGLDG